MSPFTTQDAKNLLSDIAHPKVLAQLRRFPLQEIELRSNLGADSGRHDVTFMGEQRRSSVWINTTPRVPTTYDITHAYATSTREYFALVLLHELGHVLAHTMQDTPQADMFRQQLERRIGGTDYAIGRSVIGGKEQWTPTVSEYVAETFTAAVHPCLAVLHAKDQVGVSAMQNLIASW